MMKSVVGRRQGKNRPDGGKLYTVAAPKADVAFHDLLAEERRTATVRQFSSTRLQATSPDVGNKEAPTNSLSFNILIARRRYLGIRRRCGEFFGSSRAANGDATNRTVLPRGSEQ